MLRVLLDTNIVIVVIRQRPPQALATFNMHAGRTATSAISLAELLHGAEKSSLPTENLAVVEDLCSRLEVLPCGPKAAMHHGQIRAALERQGAPMGVNDLHMAAPARSEGLVPVTNHRLEFDRVPALPVDDWLLQPAASPHPVEALRTPGAAPRPRHPEAFSHAGPSSAPCVGSECGGGCLGEGVGSSPSSPEMRYEP